MLPVAYASETKPRARQCFLFRSGFPVTSTYFLALSVENRGICRESDVCLLLAHGVISALRYIPCDGTHDECASLPGLLSVLLHTDKYAVPTAEACLNVMVNAMVLRPDRMGTKTNLAIRT